MPDAHVVYAGESMVLVLYDGGGPVWAFEGSPPSIARQHPVVHGAFVRFVRRGELLALLDGLTSMAGLAEWKRSGFDVVRTPPSALPPAFRPNALPPVLR